MAGTLYVVATPIGNLEDLTFRARRILGEVGLIAAEDTRRTAKLLAHYDIRKPLISVREHNETREAARIIARLREGVDVAIVSDAGTPGIADPGARLVHAVRREGLPIVPIPGASAITAALSVSGVDASQFVFMGFPPPKGTERETWFRDLAAEPRLVVFFEAPHRIHRTIGDLESVIRPINIIREITKINEILVEWNNTSNIESIKPLGEFVVVVAGRSADETGGPTRVDIGIEATALFDRLTIGHGVSADLAADLVACRYEIPADKLRVVMKKSRILVKRQTDA